MRLSHIGLALAWLWVGGATALWLSQFGPLVRPVLALFGLG